jgi:hypothetical protein
MSSSAPRLRKGQTVSPSDLADLARAVLADAGATHRDAADALGTQHPSISRALNADSPGVDVCTRIIEHYTDYTVRGPLYRIDRAG